MGCEDVDDPEPQTLCGYRFEGGSTTFRMNYSDDRRLDRVRGVPDGRLTVARRFDRRPVVGTVDPWPSPFPRSPTPSTRWPRT